MGDASMFSEDVQKVRCPKASVRSRPKSATNYALSRAIRHDIQSHLQMTATCDELGGYQESQASSQGTAAISARMWALNEKYREHKDHMMLV